MDKADLLEILNKRSKKSFIYHLNYKNKFSKKKYKRLIKAYQFFLLNADQIDNKEEIICQFIDTFLYTLFIFICDEDKNDLCKISPPIDPDFRTEVCLYFREMTENLIKIR